MSVSKKVFIVSGAAGVVALADYFLCADTVTGYLSASTALRYLTIAAAAVLLWGFCREIDRKKVWQEKQAGSKLSGICAAAFCMAGAVSAVLTFEPAWMICGVLLAAGSWFLVGSFAARPPRGFAAGVLLTAGLLFSTMLQYLLRPASRAHLLPVTSLLGTIAAMLLASALLRYLYLSEEPMPRQTAFFSALMTLMGALAAAQLLFAIIKGEFSFWTGARLLPQIGMGIAGVALILLVEKDMDRRLQ